MKILFFYTELANYFVAGCKELAHHAEVHVFRWPVNKEAPFEFEFGKLHVYNKNEYDYNQLETKVKEINPDLMIFSGWIDGDYNKIAKTYNKKVPTIVAFDTHWRGDLKQQILKIIAPIYLHKRFSHAWVPGQIQKEYALKLGFRNENIMEGFYTCDVNYFNTIYQSTINEKSQQFPKRFLFVGRYYDFKGVKELWQAFIELQNEMPNEWELWCAGNGDIEPATHPKIKHLGFVQPQKMKEILSKTGVFILPSHFEPWGLVVHEHAAAGFPLLLSKNVGAVGLFLEENKNGFVFSGKEINDIKRVMKQIILLNSSELIEMSKHSHQLAQKLNTEKWVQQLINFKK